MSVASLSAYRRSFSFVAAACFGCAALADWLFYDHPIGCTIALFATALLALIVSRTPRLLRSRAGFILTVASVGLLVALAIEPGPLAVMLASAGIVALSLIARGGWTESVTAWVGRVARLTIGGAFQIVRDNRLAARWFRRHPRGRAAVLWGTQLWVAPVLLGGVFVALFAIANPIIEQWVSDAYDATTDFLRTIFIRFPAARMVLWLVTAVVVWALLRWRARRVARAAHVTSYPPLPALTEAGWLRVSIVTRCLLVFNSIFAVQTMLDVIYLWGGRALPRGMTYAQYAQRGSYPLVATALLAAAFVLGAFRRGGGAERTMLTRRLVYLWIAQNVFLMISAAWRLELYVRVYSLSRWRVAAGVWMLLVALGLVSIVWRIVRGRDNAWLLRVNLVSAAVVLYACCFINIDGAIADFNATHCREAGGGGVPIDLAYLRDLGPDALPAIAWLAPQLPYAAQPVAARHADALRAELRDDLHDWRGWTLRRSRLLAADVDTPDHGRYDSPARVASQAEPRPLASRIPFP